MVLQTVTAGKPRQLELEAAARIVSAQLLMPRELPLFCSVLDPSPENGAYFKSVSSELSYPNQDHSSQEFLYAYPELIPDPVRLIISIYTNHTLHP